MAATKIKNSWDLVVSVGVWVVMGSLYVLTQGILRDMKKAHRV